MALINSEWFNSSVRLIIRNETLSFVSQLHIVSVAGVRRGSQDGWIGHCVPSTQHARIIDYD